MARSSVKYGQHKVGAATRSATPSSLNRYLVNTVSISKVTGATHMCRPIHTTSAGADVMASYGRMFMPFYLSGPGVCREQYDHAPAASIQ